MTVSQHEPRIILGGVILVTYVLLLFGETRRPLRRTVERKLPRSLRNLTNGGLSLAVVSLLQAPLLIPVARWSAARHAGLLYLLELPNWASVLLAVVLLDYTLWLWHRVNHAVPLLWRFHLVHHVDLDMDTSTAFRFHFGEMALSMFYRAIQIIVIGASAHAVWLWQTVLFAAILFHHSNLHIPFALERWLVRLTVTPRMHGIHHSDKVNETNSNFATLLPWWDHLHRTIRLNVPQQTVTIGVPAFRDPMDVRLGRILLQPFRRQRADWLLPDGSISRRAHEGSPTRLLP